MFEVENTTVTGYGKDFICRFPIDDTRLLDYRGRPVYRGEEYYIFDNGNFGGVYVHIEDVYDYLNDTRLDLADDYDDLILLIEVYHDNYPIVI